MFIKFANADMLQAEIARPGNSLMRTAHRHSFDYHPRGGFLYVRSRAISSRTNDNFDTFPAEEIKKAWATFIGKPVFVNHHNDDHRRARGVIIDAALHEDTAPDGTADTWVEVLMEIDAINFPKLAAAILAGDIERTSMGCDVAHSVCSVCGNKASTPVEYCKHIPRMKGKRIRRKTASGDGTEDVLVHEICAGLSFFENSVLVEPPADPTAFFLGVDDRGVTGMAKAASKVSSDNRRKQAAIAALNWQDHGGAFSLGDTTSDYYAFVGRPGNADGKWRYRIDTPYGSLIDAGFDSADEAKAAAEDAMDDETRSGLYVTTSSLRSVASLKESARHRHMAASGPYKVCRGFQVAITDRDVAERVKAGKATSSDLMSMVESDGVGIFWGLLDRDPSKPEWEQWDVSRSREYAHTEYNPWNEYETDFDAGEYGEIGVVLIGLSPVAPDDFNLAIPERTPVKITEISYGAGTNWFTIPVSLAVTASRTAAAEVNVSEYKDYKTGFVTYRAEVSVPGFDYSADIPMYIGVTVEQFMTDTWSVMGVYGPYNSPNSKGKFSDVVLMNQFIGKKADAKRLAMREAKRMYSEWMSGPKQRTASVKRTASNEAEVDAFIASFPDSLRSRAEALKHRMVYGQEYSRGISDNLIDAARFARQGVDDSAEWYILKAEAKEVALLGGEFVPARHPGNEKTAGLSDLTYGPTQPDRNAGTRWEGVPTDRTGYSVIVLWPGDEVTLLSAVMRDYERAVEWAQMARSAGAVDVFVRDNVTGITAKASLGQRRHAFGETKAPAAIDTLRSRECPVCGEDESSDSDGRCRVCGYLPPPEPFRDPDLDVAQKVDMRQGPVNIDLYSAPSFLSPDEDDEGDDTGNPVQDDQSPSKKQKNASQGDAMRPTIAAAARQQEIIKVQAQTIARMKREMNVLRRMADASNPAQPVAEPGAQAPAATTDQTRAADATIEVTNPGGVMAAPMATSFDLTTPGGVIPASPAANQEVTAPVAGYEQPVADMRTEVNVINSGETIGENYVQGDWANTTASRHQARTFASLRLARLRLQAGVERGDDIALAQRIASSRLSDEAIRNEINSLSKIPTVASRRPTAPIRQQAVRNVPSLVSTAAPVVAVAAPSMSPNDDEFLFS